MCYRYGVLSEKVPAFRWKYGKTIGLAVDGDITRNTEYMYIHFRRKMIFDESLADDDSFMICPLGFVKDHEFSEGEMQALMMPCREYEMMHNYERRSALKTAFIRMKLLMTCDAGARRMKMKIFLNRLLGRRLHSKWE